MPPGACEEAYQRKAVIAYSESEWEPFIKKECNRIKSDNFAVSRGLAIKRVI